MRTEREAHRASPRPKLGRTRPLSAGAPRLVRRRSPSKEAAAAAAAEAATLASKRAPRWGASGAEGRAGPAGGRVGRAWCPGAGADGRGVADAGGGPPWDAALELARLVVAVEGKGCHEAARLPSLGSRPPPRGGKMGKEIGWWRGAKEI